MTNFQDIKNIAILTQQQNQNLKEQNSYLLQKLRKMQQRQQKMKKIYAKTKSYKNRWQEICQQIQIIKQQTFIYRSLLQDYREITMVDIPVLKNKVKQTQIDTLQYEDQERYQNMNINLKKRDKQLEQSSSTTLTATAGKKSLSMHKITNKQQYQCIYEQSEEAQQKTFGSFIDIDSHISPVSHTRKHK